MRPFYCRQRKVEAGAPVYCGFRPDFAAVAMDDSLYRGQPDSTAGELRFRVQTSERTEQVGRMSRIKSSAIVAHEVRAASRAIDARAEFDAGIGCLGSELPCVPQQVLQ